MSKLYGAMSFPWRTSLLKSLAQDLSYAGAVAVVPCSQYTAGSELHRIQFAVIKRIRITILLLLLATVLPGLSSASEWQFNDVDRIVAISDIHGAYGAMLRTLQNAGVISDDLSWSGGKTHLVIVGDILDRGPNSRDAMDLLMRLEGEAQAAGGRVHVLIGNHEAMNLTGDLRYVSRAEYAAFADEETAAERMHWFEAYAVRSGAGEAEKAALRINFDSQFPPGFFAHRRAFAIDGEYGKWLLGKPVIVVIDGTAFVHGGLSPMVGELGLEGVNGTLKQELVEYLRLMAMLIDAGELLPIDSFNSHEQILARFMPGLETSKEIVTAVAKVIELGESDLHAPDGPLWYRGNVACSRLIEEDRLLASLRAIGAERVVIGHTPTPGRRVLQRMSGRIIEVDTGMLNNYYSGRGNALILEGDNVGTISEDSAELVSAAEHPRRVGARPGDDLTASDLEHLLRTGDIVASLELEAGRQIIHISDGQQTIEALFAKRQGRGFYADAAAYQLDRLLEFDMVPVAVRREVDGVDGSVQFLPHRWQDEQQRGASGLGGSAQCGLDMQWGAMYVFDSLIYNEGRSVQRMIYSPDIWQLVLVGHDRAFGTKKGRPQYLKTMSLVIGDAWQAALASLTADVLERELGDVLDKRRRRALLARRDVLIE